MSKQNGLDSSAAHHVHGDHGHHTSKLHEAVHHFLGKPAAKGGAKEVETHITKSDVASVHKHKDDDSHAGQPRVRTAGTAAGAGSGSSEKHLEKKVASATPGTETPIRAQATSLLNSRDGHPVQAASIKSGSDIKMTPLKFGGTALAAGAALDLAASRPAIAPTQDSLHMGARPIDAAYNAPALRTGDGRALGAAQLSGAGEGAAFVAPPGAGDGRALAAAQSGAPAAAGTDHVDTKKSISDSLQSGNGDLKLVDKRSAATDSAAAQNKLQPGQTPSIEVQYQNQDAGKPQSQSPDFIVKKDGSVEVMHDPEKNPNAHIVVQVERDKGQVGDPTAAQKKAIDELVPYLADRVKNNPSYDQLSHGQVQVNDGQHLMSDAAAKQIHNDVSHPGGQTDQPVPQVPENVSNVSGRMGRVAGSGGGHESFAPHGDGTIPQRTVPPAADNTPPVQAVQDTIAAMSGADKQHPYEHVAHRSDGSYGVGRYGLNHGNMAGWMAKALGIDLGDPPDYSKLEQYLKDHPEAEQGLEQKMQDLAKDKKVDQKFADQFKDADFRKGFVDSIQKMDGKHGELSSADVKKYMPKELQETVAQDRVQDYAKKMGVDTNNMQEHDPGKLALSMYLGRPATQQDLANPANQNYENSADNLYKLARAGQFTDGRVDVSENAGHIVATAASKVGQQVWAQTQWANAVQGGNLGCAATISKILQDSGSLKHGEGSASVTGLADVLAKHGWQRIAITDKSQFHPGDVVYGTNGGTHGHIGLIGEVTNGQVWEYDNSSSRTTLQHRTVEQGGSFVPVNNGRSRFGRNLYVMRPPGGDA